MIIGVTIEIRSIFGLIVALVFILILWAASRRLLGVRVGRGRGLAASVVGCAIGAVAALEVEVGRKHHPAEVIGLAVVFGVLATMVLIIIIQVLTRPPGVHHRLGGRMLLHPIRRCRVALSPVGRSVQVARCARHRGLAKLEFLSSEAMSSEEFGHRLRLTLEDAGGMFVKFGQIASTRGDLLAEPVTTELAELRASVRPIPPDALRDLLEDSLDQPVESVCSSFDWEPLAAASIGQTHRAVLHDGTRVVVKVQRPGMDELMRRDGTVLRLAAGFADRRIPAAHRLGVRELAEELIVGMERELDYLREATMSRRLQATLDDTGAVRIPGVFHEVSSARLLVMEEAVGQSVDDLAAVDACGVPRSALADRLLRSFLRQVFQGGVYHADPHPGNVLVGADGTLWLLDFGAVGLLDAVARQSLQEMALGMAMGEPVLVARAVRRLAGADAMVDLRLLESDVGILMVETDAGGSFDPRIIHEVVRVMGRHGLRVPRSMTLLSRALLTLDGTLRIIDPHFDLADRATTFVRETSHTDDEISDDLVRHELLRALPLLRVLPEHADELATQLRAGTLQVKVERYGGEDERRVNRWVDRALVAMVGAVGAVLSGLLLVAGSLSNTPDMADSLRGLGFIGLVFSCVLLMRTVAQALQRERTKSVE